MANYESNMEHYEYRYQQSGRNWVRKGYYVYDYEGAERLKEIVRAGGLLGIDDDTGARLIEEPGYWDITKDDIEPQHNRLMEELELEYKQRYGIGTG